MGFENFDGCRLPPTFSETKDEIDNFEVRNEDIWVTSYPKSGTTWVQEMVWLVQNNFDYDGAKVLVTQRFSFIEYKSIHDSYKTNTTAKDWIKILPQIPNTRFIKSHLPWQLLPRQIRYGQKQPKIIHVIRNPKQVSVSYFHHQAKMFYSFDGDISDFVDQYIKGEVLYGDYFNTVLSYWNNRHLPNLLILTYEEMKHDLKSAIGKVCEFLGKNCTHDEVDKLAKHLSFENMQTNPAVNFEYFLNERKSKSKFIRQGKVDGYKQELSKENIQKLGLWVKERIKGTGLPYETEETVSL